MPLPQGLSFRPPWAVCFPHVRIIAAHRGLLCSSYARRFTISSSGRPLSFLRIGKCLLAIIIYHQGIHYPALTCNLLSCLHTTMLLSLRFCDSACSRHSGIQRVLNCARMLEFYLAFLFAFVIDGPWPCISVICEVNTAATCGSNAISATTYVDSLSSTSTEQLSRFYIKIFWC